MLNLNGWGKLSVGANKVTGLRDMHFSFPICHARLVLGSKIWPYYCYLPSFSFSSPHSPCSNNAWYILILTALCSHRWYESIRPETFISFLSALPLYNNISNNLKDFKDVFSDVFEHDWIIMVCQSIPSCSRYDLFLNSRISVAADKTKVISPYLIYCGAELGFYLGLTFLVLILFCGSGRLAPKYFFYSV